MRLGGDPMEAVPLTQASDTGEGRGPGEIGNAHLWAGSVCETQTVVQFVERKLYCHWQQDSSFVQRKLTTQAMERESVSGFLFYLVLGWERVCLSEVLNRTLYHLPLRPTAYLTCLGG